MDATRFSRQHDSMANQVKDIVEEIALNEKLLLKLKNHAMFMTDCLKYKIPPEKFVKSYSKASTTLVRYLSLLTEFNCKLEVMLTEEWRDWSNLCDGIYHSKPYFDVNFNIKDDLKQDLPNNPTNQDIKLGRSQKGDLGNSVPKDTEFHSDLGSFIEDQETKNRILLDKVISGMSNSFSSKAIKFFKKSLFNSEGNRKMTGMSSNSQDECVNSNSSSSGRTRSTFVKSQPSEDTRPKEIIFGKIISASILEDYDSDDNIHISTLKISRVPKKKYRGHISCVVTPSEFYVHFATGEYLQIVECDNKLESLRRRMSERNSVCLKHRMNFGWINKENLASAKEPKRYFLHYCEKKKVFYRVEVVDWMLENNSELVRVFFIDYGNSRDVDLDSLYPMEISLVKYPAFAVRCHLWNLCPEMPVIPESNDEVIQFMNIWAEKNDDIVIVIGEDDSNTSSNSIPVVIYSTDMGECLNELISRKLINSTVDDTSSLSDSDEEVESWNPMQEEFDSNLNHYDIDIDDPSSVIYGYVGKDYERTCKHFRNTSQCYKGEACRKEHLFLDRKGFTTDKEETFNKPLNELRLPAVNDELNAYITTIISATEFYCVLDQQNQNDETLLSLVSFMNEKKNILEMKKLSIPPSIGQLVIGKFSVDHSWYRAMVLEVIPEKNFCTLFFVDYGNTETVNFSSVRAMEARYLHLPYQAVFCTINGISNKDEKKVEAIRYLDRLLSRKISIRVLSILPSRRPHLLVELFDEDGQNVAEKLLENKLVNHHSNFIIADEAEDVVPG